jgi:hypothetical protein
MTRDEEYRTFLAGWRACRERLLRETESYSSDWLPNGPSKATADAIIKKMSAVPEPRSEDE